MNMLKNKPIILLLHIYLSLFSSATKLKMEIESNVCHNKLNNIMKNFIKQFESGLLLHVVVSDDNCLSTDVMKEIFKSLQIVLTEVNSIGFVNDILLERPNVYVLIITNWFTINQIHMAISKLMDYSLAWNPGAKFLLILITSKYPKNIRFELVKDTFNYLWKRNILQTALVIIESNENECTLFSSSPYSNIYETCKEITTPTQLQEVTLSNTQLSQVNIVGYNYKTPKTFSGCPLIAYTFPLPPYSVVDNSQNDTTVDPIYKLGMEIELVFLLSVKYNFSLDLNTPEYYLQNNGYSYQLPNGTFVGMFEDIVNYKIDLAFCGTIPSCSRYYLIEYCYTQMINSVSWYVPGGEPMSSWHLISNAFTISSWLLLSTACVSFPMLYEMVSVRTASRPLPQPASLIMWQTLLGVSMQWSPDPIHLRLLLFSWSLFGLHITIMFTTRLLSLLTERPVEAGVNTIQGLQKSGLKACMSELYRNYYINRTESYTRLIIEGAVICNNVENVIQQFLDYRNFSILAKDDFITFLLDLEKVNVNRLEQHFVTYPVSMIVTKGSFLKNILDKLLMRAFSAGLFHKWLNNVLQDSNGTYIPTSKNQTKKHVLRFEDFTWLFILLLIGYSAALLIFIIEIFYPKLKQKSNEM